MRHFRPEKFCQNASSISTPKFSRTFRRVYLTRIIVSDPLLHVSLQWLVKREEDSRLRVCSTHPSICRAFFPSAAFIGQLFFFSPLSSGFLLSPLNRKPEPVRHKCEFLKFRLIVLRATTFVFRRQRGKDKRLDFSALHSVTTTDEHSFWFIRRIITPGSWAGKVQMTLRNCQANENGDARYCHTFLASTKSLLRIPFQFENFVYLARLLLYLAECERQFFDNVTKSHR